MKEREDSRLITRFLKGYRCLELHALPGVEYGTVDLDSGFKHAKFEGLVRQ